MSLLLIYLDVLVQVIACTKRRVTSDIIEKICYKGLMIIIKLISNEIVALTFRRQHLPSLSNHPKEKGILNYDPVDR